MSVIHKFESAGLGLAPFRLVGMSEKRCSGQPDSQGITVGYPGQPAGTCDYCGTGIANCFQIQSADGKLFVVGEDCVRKTDDTGLVDTVKRQANKVRTEAKHLKDDATIKSAAPLVEAHCKTFDNQPHPNAWLASEGNTLGQYMRFCYTNSGRTRKLKLIKQWL